MSEGEKIVTTKTVEVRGQCAWCLQSDRQAFALLCPEHVSHWRDLLNDLQTDIQALCRAVGEFDGARPESPQIVLRICTERAAEWRRMAEAYRAATTSPAHHDEDAGGAG